MGRSGFEKWVEDEKRPGGVGRTERERVFWERVASGQRSYPPGGGGRSSAEGATEGPWESAQIAVVTLLTVVVFGLGWVTLELEGALARTGYDASPPAAGAFDSNLESRWLAAEPHVR